MKSPFLASYGILFFFLYVLARRELSYKRNSFLASYGILFFFLYVLARRELSYKKEFPF
jgi:hypothetical protein